MPLYFQRRYVMHTVVHFVLFFVSKILRICFNENIEHDLMGAIAFYHMSMTYIFMKSFHCGGFFFFLMKCLNIHLFKSRLFP